MSLSDTTKGIFVKKELRKELKIKDILGNRSVLIDPFDFSFNEYLELSPDERKIIQIRAYDEKEEWCKEELRKRDAEWMLVCGGEIIEYSSTLRNYPSNDKLMQIGEEKGRIPFVFINPVDEIEEGGGEKGVSWSELANEDYYPTIGIKIGKTEWDEDVTIRSGEDIIADFDTGAPHIYLDFDCLSENNFVSLQLSDFIHKRYHLGEVYWYYYLPVRIGLINGKGRIRSKIFRCLCIVEWKRSPFRKINPKRNALVGRTILLTFPLNVELNGKRRVTRLFHV